MPLHVREARSTDLAVIRRIYNEGIIDRIATLEESEKDAAFMDTWFGQHDGRYAVIVAEREGEITGWASLNRYSPRAAYDGVADISVYIGRGHRGTGIGSVLLAGLEEAARRNGFHKLVLFTFPFNGLGQGLYRKRGFREVGVFRNQGRLDGKFVDVMAMEKLLDETEPDRGGE